MAFRYHPKVRAIIIMIIIVIGKDKSQCGVAMTFSEMISLPRLFSAKN